MPVKRTLRRIAERVLDVRIVHHGEVAPVFERDHLRRFFDRFQVDCVFDVGANAGQYASMLRKDVGYQGYLISYEPIPEMAAKLRELAAGDPAWFIEELALDAAAGSASLNVFTGSQFSSLHEVSRDGSDLFRNQTQLSRRIDVRTATAAAELLRYRDQLGFERPFLKLDTQGHDLSVARGAGQELRQFIGIQSELAIRRLYADSPSYEEALEFYQGNGFELSALVPNNLGHFPRLLEIDCILYRRDAAPSDAARRGH